MEDGRLSLPDSCVTCPYFEFFSRSCGHGDRQTIVRELVDDEGCPYFEEIRSDAMRELASRLEDS